MSFFVKVAVVFQVKTFSWIWKFFYVDFIHWLLWMTDSWFLCFQSVGTANCLILLLKSRYGSASKTSWMLLVRWSPNITIFWHTDQPRQRYINTLPQNVLKKAYNIIVLSYKMCHYISEGLLAVLKAEPLIIITSIIKIFSTILFIIRVIIIFKITFSEVVVHA